MSRTATIVRFLICGLLSAAVFVFGGGWLIHRYLGNQPQQTISIKVARGITLIHSVPGLDNSTDKSREKPQRQVPGFVQVGYTIGQDGRAHDVHVLRAVPEGVYDDAAQAVIKGRHFKPVKSKSAARAKHSQIVHFRVPKSKLKGKRDGGGSSD